MKLLLVNPNLTQAVTDAVAAAARGAARFGTEISAVGGTLGPQVIGSRAKNALAAHTLLDLVASRSDGVDVVVLAVPLDSALWARRELLDKPVVDMTETALLTASMLGTRIGVLTYGARLGPVYRELVEAYGLGSRLAGVETVHVIPQQTFSDPERVLVFLLDGVACAVGMAEMLVTLKLPRPRVGSLAPTGGREVHGIGTALQQLFAQRG